MLDAIVRDRIDPPLDWAGRRLAALGIGADARPWRGSRRRDSRRWARRVGRAPPLASRLADGLDGAVARATRPTDFGGFLDIATALRVAVRRQAGVRREREPTGGYAAPRR